MNGPEEKTTVKVSRLNAMEAMLQAAEAMERTTRDPAGVAEMYAHLDSLQQAKFWEHVATEFEAFGGGKGCLQNCLIVEDLCDKAKDYIKNLHGHIVLAEQDNG